MVTSPFQYMCACEAKAHYKTKNNILLLVNQIAEPGISQQNKLINFQEWDHVISIPRKNRTKYTPYAIKQIRKLLKGESLQHFFHAEYNGWRTKLLLRNLPVSKEVYFDDGTLTIQEYEVLIRTRKPYYRKRLLQDMWIKMRGCKPIGHMPQSSSLEIFTIFDIDKPEHKVVKNRFAALRKRYGDPKLYNPDAPIGFIGQGAIGHKRMKSISDYVEEIKTFREQHVSDILYFPHRTESEGVKTQLLSLEGLKYHYSELPLEIELIDKNIELSGLVGINSTAQYTALSLYEDMPVYNLISSLDLNSSTVSATTKRVHDLFQRSGIIDIEI